jgi:hypothetical protein
MLASQINSNNEWSTFSSISRASQGDCVMWSEYCTSWWGKRLLLFRCKIRIQSFHMCLSPLFEGFSHERLGPGFIIVHR